MTPRSAMLFLSVVAALPSLAEEFRFDASEFEKKRVEYSGYVEQKVEALALQPETAAYRLSYPDEAARHALTRATSTLELSGKLNLDPLVLDVRAQASHARDEFGRETLPVSVMEGGMRWSAGPGASVDVGKRVQRWGKGYAWSPVGFIERAKDPSDPAAAREGLVMASAEWTRRFDGPVSVLGLAGFLVPVTEHLNGDFGQTRHSNPAARLTLLAWDTDIDLLWRARGSKPAAFGFDFSRNLSPALEVHGEWARTLDVTQVVVDAAGTARNRVVDTNSALVGARYLTEGEVTWIAEWYRNGAGYSRDELSDWRVFLERATAPEAPDTLMAKAATLSRAGLGRANPGRDYAYVKASVNEPLGWVYGAAAVSLMTNLHDGSWQLTPEVSYTGFNNVELRARVFVFGGAAGSEFAEKPSSRRIELSARFHF